MTGRYRTGWILFLAISLGLGVCAGCQEQTSPILPDGTYEVFLKDLNLESQTILVDEMEFISIFELERIDELGLDPEEDFPSGFYLYNEAESWIEMPLEGDPHIEVVMWGEQIEAKWLTVEELKSHIEEYEAPYSILIQNGEIIEIFEMYVP